VAAAVQLAPLVDWIDLDGAALLAEDPFDGPGLEEGGAVRFNEGPGFGVRVAGECGGGGEGEGEGRVRGG
jgi:L-Ala-D/L-Glu epimerase